MERRIVDVATTSKSNLKISSRETNKMDRLASAKYRPQGYSSTLQLYVKQGQYTAQQLDDNRKSLTDYIKNSGLKNVNAQAAEIPPSN
jgi:hypothetical protein